MASDDMSGILRNMDTLLGATLPQSYQSGGVLPALNQDKEFAKQVAKLNQMTKRGFGMGGDTAPVGISLPQLLGNYRSGVMAPVLYGR